MNTEVELEVSEIIQMFDMDEVTKFIQEQIFANEYRDLTDHFHQIYLAYRKLEAKSMDDETRKMASDKFEEICYYIIKSIVSRFNLTISSDYIETNIANIGAITLSLYVFFVIDLSKNLMTVLDNYMVRNKKELCETFETLKAKRDSATINTKRVVKDPDLALIIANIYDISDYIFDLISGESFIEYLDTDYVPAEIIRQLYDKDVLAGDFMEPLSVIYKDNIELKNTVCVDLMYKYTTN